MTSPSPSQPFPGPQMPMPGPDARPITVPLEPCCGVIVGEEHDCLTFAAEMVAAFANPIRFDFTRVGAAR